MNKINYFKFEPVLKQTLWGGDKIIPFKQLGAQLKNVGESWEISGVPGSETHCQGKSLNELVSEMKGQLVGMDNYERFGNEFPLLVKFIDAQKDLSIQVHPNDEVARRHGKERGKTEMWYIMHADNGAKLYNGLKKPITPEEYRQRVADDTICDVLAEYTVSEGDCFFIPAGRIHAIGAGCFLAEIQQTSDVTYRIYDFNRRDKDGNLRQLHTAEASESIDYKVEKDYRTNYSPRKNEAVQIAACPYFTTAVYDLDEPMTLDYSELDSFVILIALSGEATLLIDGETTTLRQGESILLPAYINNVYVEGKMKFLETYV